jgi:hypothetical protein
VEKDNYRKDLGHKNSQNNLPLINLNDLSRELSEGPDRKIKSEVSLKVKSN